MFVLLISYCMYTVCIRYFSEELFERGLKYPLVSVATANIASLLLYYLCNTLAPLALLATSRGASIEINAPQIHK